MNTFGDNWRENCKSCLYFEECKSNKSAIECKSFLDKKMIEQMKDIFKNSKAE